jgi:hypothetical protein
MARPRKLDNPTALVSALFSVGNVESVGDPASAITRFQESLRIAERVGTATGFVLMGNLGCLARCYAAVGDAPETVATIGRGVLAARDRAPLGY